MKPLLSIGRSKNNMWEKELEVAIEAGLLARVKIMEIYNQDFDVEIKDDNSPVTNADKAADAIIRECLHKAFPTHAFLTEESEDNEERMVHSIVSMVRQKEFMLTINSKISHVYVPCSTLMKLNLN